MKFSKTTRCFYPDYAHYATTPDDLIEVTQGGYAAAMSRGPGEALDVVNGQLVIVPAPVIAPELLAAQAKAAQIRAVAAQVQAHLDAQAVALGYDNIFTAVTYATEPAVPKFQNDGIALRAWRSLVWAKCYEVLAEIDAGTREPLDAAQLLALLPTFSQEQA